ncbi:hypothetical protein [Mesobacterium pallidum]|uniref:hypothetical protein n=1 Tax=Mesobacterium pallidum TaxID=2872037 RepID=UPI001EE33FC5|nr:hypothetical protein [Mesobacterium pallidum]
MTRHPRDLDLPAPSALSPERGSIAPVVYAGGMLAAGALLLLAKPRIGEVPDPRHRGDAPRRSRVRRAAQHGRDAAQTFAPTNLTDSIGRSLLIGGAALLIARTFDALTGSDGD